MKAKESADEYMARLEHPLKVEIEALRTIIKNANSAVQERVKWNAPSYFYDNVDMAAFNLRQQKFVQIIFVFPNGLIDDNSGLLQGTWTDRREARFANMAEIETRKADLENVVNRWFDTI